MLTIITMVISKHNNPVALGQGLGSGWSACLSSGSASVALSCCFRILLELQGTGGREWGLPPCPQGNAPVVSRSCFSSEGCWGLCLPTPPSSGWGPHLPQGHGCPQPPSFCPRGRLPLSAGRPCGCGSFPEVSPLLEAVLAQLSRACPGTCPSPSPIHTGLRRATAGAGGHKPDGGKLRQASLPAQDLILTPHLLVRSSRAPSAHRARLPAPAPLVGDPGRSRPGRLPQGASSSVFPGSSSAGGPGPAAVPVGGPGEGGHGRVSGFRMRRLVSGLEGSAQARAPCGTSSAVKRVLNACRPQLAPRPERGRDDAPGWSPCSWRWS